MVNFVEAERTTDLFLDKLKRSLKLEDVAGVVNEQGIRPDIEADFV